MNVIEVLFALMHMVDYWSGHITSNVVATLELMVGPQYNVYHDPSIDEANLNLLPGQATV